MTNLPLRHVSIRVPWHDSGWAGVVCSAPHLNGACAKLKGIANSKDDAQEIKFAGKRLDEISTADWPACVHERGMFMVISTGSGTTGFDLFIVKATIKRLFGV